MGKRILFILLIGLLFSCSSSKTSSKSKLVNRNSNDPTLILSKIDTALLDSTRKEFSDSCKVLELKDGSTLFIKSEIFKDDTLNFLTCDSMESYSHFTEVKHIKTITDNGDTLFYNTSKQDIPSAKETKTQEEINKSDKLAKTGLFVMILGIFFSILAPELLLLLGVLVGIYLLYLYLSGKRKSMTKNWKLFTDIMALLYLSFVFIVGLVVLFISLFFW